MEEKRLEREHPILNRKMSSVFTDKEIIEQFDKILRNQSGPAGIIKKWCVVIIVYGEIKEIFFDTEEEATIAYFNIYNEDNTKDKQIYLTIGYLKSF